MNERELLSTTLQNRASLLGPGGVVCTLRCGAHITAVAGLADVENAVPIANDTSFHVASLAKQFTAFLIASLAVEGRLDLDGPVGEILDWLRPPTSLCTIRQLILHTAGLRDHWVLSEYAGLRDGDSITTEDACGWIAAQGGLNFTPGTRFLYSNSGYVLLARVIEKLEALAFAEAARRRIFGPLGMVGTFFVDDPARSIPHRARGYRQDGEGWSRCEPNYGVLGATCLRTNVRDMLTWLATPLDGAFFTRVAGVGYLRPGALDDGSPIRYGFGQIHSSLGGRPVILHGGYDYGFNAIVLRDPANGDGLFAASNGSTPAIEGAAMGWFAEWAKGGPSGATDLKPKCRATVCSERPKHGVYVRDDLTDLRVISEVGDGLKIFWNQDMDFAPTGDGRWAVVGTPVVACVAGETIVFSNGFDDVRLSLVKTEPYDPCELDGSYLCNALGSILRIETNEGRTTLAIGRGRAHELTSVNRDLLLFGENWLAVERTGDRIVSLRLFQMRCSGVEFRPLEA